MTAEINTLADFEAADNAHDLTYRWADSGGEYGRGADSEDRIFEAAKKFDPADVERIWNTMVDRRRGTFAAKEFYWARLVKWRSADDDRDQDAG
jgi:hypothetical protein